MKTLAGRLASRTSSASIVTGIAWGAASAFAPASFDEGNWLAIARRMDLGKALYSDLVDNKSPLLYGAVRLLDHAPGSYSFARGVFFGALIAAIVAATAGLARRFEMPQASSAGVGFVVGSVVAFQSVFVLNTETCVVLLVLIGLLLVSRERPVLGAAVAASATAIDIRAVVFLPAALLLLRERHGARSALAATLTGVSIVAACLVPVFLFSNLRYALIELNAASRGPLTAWQPGAVLAVAAVTLGPLVAVALAAGYSPRALLGAARGSPARAYLVAVSCAVAVASVYPFFKYWILITPAVPLIAAAAARMNPGPTSQREGTMKKALVGLVFVPLIAHAPAAILAERELVTRYERAAHVLRVTLRPGDTFVAFDPQPFMTTLLPDHAALPWAVLDFLAVRTSRRQADLRTVARAIDGAAAVVDDGALSVRESAVDSQYRDVWRLYERRLRGFPCVLNVESVTIRLRTDRCPSGAGRAIP